MNRIHTTLIALTLGSLWTFSILPGCRTIATPTFPATNTPVLTSTPTFTSTPVLTPTPTFTKTNSPTPTNTGTFTFSPTPGSPTSTPTITNTSTNTDTPTITNTPAPATNTPTFVPCNATSVQTTYTFDTTFDCWHLDSSSNSVVSLLDISNSVKHSGTGSMQAVVTEPASSTNVQMDLVYSPAANLTGVTITAWVYVDPSLAGASVQVFTQSGSGWTWNSGGWTTPTGGTWTQVTWTPPFSTAGEDSTQVQQIGFQFYGVPANASGNIYIDDVSLTGLGGPTATPTPSGCTTAPTFNSTYPFIWNNDNYCAVPTGWSTNNNSGTITVPGLALSSAQNYTVACSSNCGSLLAGPIPFTAANQSANVEYVFPSGTTGTDITGKTISAYYYLDATPSNAGYGQMYIQDSATYDYQSLGFGGTYALTTGAWTQISIPANQGGVNPAKIWKFGIQIGTGASATSGFQNVNLYIDDMTIQ